MAAVHPGLWETGCWGSSFSPPTSPRRPWPSLTRARRALPPLGRVHRGAARTVDAGEVHLKRRFLPDTELLTTAPAHTFWRGARTGISSRADTSNAARFNGGARAGWYSSHGDFDGCTEQYDEVTRIAPEHGPTVASASMASRSSGHRGGGTRAVA